MQLFNLTHNGRQYVSELPPSMFPRSAYSFVKIHYSDIEIITIIGTYFNTIRSEVSLEDLDIQNHLANLDIFVNGLSDEDKNEICNMVRFITLPDEPEMSIDEKIKKIFVLGLSSYLSYAYFLTTPLSQEILGIEYTFPYSIKMNLLDNNVYNYLEYLGSVIVAINNDTIGKHWWVQIKNFFDAFSSILPSEFIISSELKTEITHVAIRGYSGYVYGEILKAINLFGTAECSADKALNKINTEVDEIYDEVKLFKTRLFTDLEQRRTEMHDSLSVELKQLLYDEVPEISNRVEKSLDLKLYKILTKKIEECFGEVLLDYKETAAYRLRDVLEPVVFESIEKFKSVVNVSENMLKTAVEDCRKYGGMAKDYVETVDELWNDLHILTNNIEEENKLLKKEIKELQDEVYSLGKLVERLCIKNNLKI